ncbi:MAG TPA: hypothetical protein VIY29_21390 [Ktedonobacteraceae bacterium]
MADRKTSSPKVTEEENGTWRELPWRKLEVAVYRLQKRMCAMWRTEVSPT